MKRHWIFKGCLIFAVLLIISHQLTAKQPKKNEIADWPRFRGPEGTGISQETGLLETWPDGGPNEIWRVPIGAGYSGITVADERLFTMGSDEEAEFLICLDPANGKDRITFLPGLGTITDYFKQTTELVSGRNYQREWKKSLYF